MSKATEVLENLYGAFAAGDGDRLGALLGNTHWVEASGGPYGGTYNGFAEVAANVFGPIGNDVTDFSARPDTISPVGDDAALALGFYRGKTAHGPFEIRFAHLAHIDGDAIVRFEQFTDTHQWQAATAG